MKIPLNKQERRRTQDISLRHPMGNARVIHGGNCATMLVLPLFLKCPVAASSTFQDQHSSMGGFLNWEGSCPRDLATREDLQRGYYDRNMGSLGLWFSQFSQSLTQSCIFSLVTLGTHISSIQAISACCKIALILQCVKPFDKSSGLLPLEAISQLGLNSPVRHLFSQKYSPQEYSCLYFCSSAISTFTHKQASLCSTGG